MSENIVYIVESFDLSIWLPNHRVIAFLDRDLAEKFCEDHSTNTIKYSYSSMFLNTNRIDQ